MGLKHQKLVIAALIYMIPALERLRQKGARGPEPDRAVSQKTTNQPIQETSKNSATLEDSLSKVAKHTNSQYLYQWGWSLEEASTNQDGFEAGKKEGSDLHD